MTEPRFACPQCQAVCHSERCWPGCGHPQSFNLPGVLAHWRWHTEQAADRAGSYAASIPHYSGGHVLRMSPAFTLTLIDKWALPAIERHRLGGFGWCSTCAVDESNRSNWPCDDYLAVAAVVVAAGFEKVTP